MPWCTIYIHLQIIIGFTVRAFGIIVSKFQKKAFWHPHRLFLVFFVTTCTWWSPWMGISKWSHDMCISHSRHVDANIIVGASHKHGSVERLYIQIGLHIACCIQLWFPFESDVAHWQSQTYRPSTLFSSAWWVAHYASTRVTTSLGANQQYAHAAVRQHQLDSQVRITYQSFDKASYLASLLRLRIGTELPFQARRDEEQCCPKSN